MILQSIITCPKCGAANMETMPTNACQYLYECTGCGTKLQPNGSVPCPPTQVEHAADFQSLS